MTIRSSGSDCFSNDFDSGATIPKCLAGRTNYSITLVFDGVGIIFSSRLI